MIIRLYCLSALLLLSATSIVLAQGMPIDSLSQRLAAELSISNAAAQLRGQIPEYDELRVWGLAIGDFSNDATSDLAISLYDLNGPKQQVKVYLFQNRGGALRKMMVRSASFVESPIEVGLSIDESVVSIIQRLSEDQWFQEGYSIQFGDVMLIERFETDNQAGARTRLGVYGRQIHRNYETLLTREAYYGGANGETLLDAAYYTIPAYGRFRSIYPGYGSWMRDTSSQFILQGLEHRRDAWDLSISQALAAYDREFIFVTISVADDYLSNGHTRVETNDRVTLWFDASQAGDRKLRGKRSGTPSFRTVADSFLYSVTIPLPLAEGPITGIQPMRIGRMTSLQSSSAEKIRAQFAHDTMDGRFRGYTIRARIPWEFLGFESNPVSLYETRSPVAANQSEEVEIREEDSPTLGFTAVVSDVDDPHRPAEQTVQATSRFRESDPTSLGTLDLKPSRQFYGYVHVTYLEDLKRGLREAGY